MKYTVLIYAFMSLLACEKQSPAPQQVVVQAPTATEVFNLRSKCADLGEQILENNIVGVALTQSQTSHYDPKTNRCYVELTVQTGDTTRPLTYLSQTLYDGQTKEILAFARTEDGKNSGMVFVPAANPANDFFANATAFINKMMEDDRSQ